MNKLRNLAEIEIIKGENTNSRAEKNQRMK